MSDRVARGVRGEGLERVRGSSRGSRRVFLLEYLLIVQGGDVNNW